MSGKGMTKAAAVRSMQTKTWDDPRGQYVTTGAHAVTRDGEDVTVEVAERTAVAATKATRVVTAAQALKRAEREAAKAPAASAGREDRSVPVSSISLLWGQAFNARAQALDPAAPLADPQDLAAVLEDYAVRSMQAELRAMAKVLTAKAKTLTANDVRALGNVSGSQVTLTVPGLVTGEAAREEGSRPGKGADRSSGNASVRFTPDPSGVMGRDLRDIKVTPRALPKVATCGRNAVCDHGNATCTRPKDHAGDCCGATRD